MPQPVLDCLDAPSVGFSIQDSPVDGFGDIIANLIADRPLFRSFEPIVSQRYPRDFAERFQHPFLQCREAFVDIAGLSDVLTYEAAVPVEDARLGFVPEKDRLNRGFILSQKFVEDGLIIDDVAPHTMEKTK